MADRAAPVAAKNWAVYVALAFITDVVLFKDHARH
jgi:hypothetical protein